MDGLTREAKGKNRFWFAGLLLVLLLLLLLLGGGWHGNIKCDPSRTKDRARENWIEKQPLPSLRLLLRLLLVVQVVGWRTPSCRSRLTATFDYYSPPLLYSILFKSLHLFFFFFFLCCCGHFISKRMATRQECLSGWSQCGTGKSADREEHKLSSGSGGEWS